MPRPKSIIGRKRVEVFLNYRLGGGKVNPVANRHRISRSTVRVIVKEFEDLGFSPRPRAKVSVSLLKEMQEQHITGLVELPGMGVGQINIGPGTDNEEERQVAFAQPLSVGDESWWHLKDTEAEMVVEEARNAIRDYLHQETEAWQALASALEKACGLPEREGEIREDPDPHLLPALKRRLWLAFFDAAFLLEPPGQDWLDWDVDPDDAEVLRLRERVAIGSPDDHQRIKEGVESFLTDGFKDLQRRFFEVHRLRQDIKLMQGVVEKSLGTITPDDLGRGICPACPYPEGSLEPNTNPEAERRSSKQE